MTGGRLYDITDPDIEARIEDIDTEAQENRKKFKDNPNFTSNTGSYDALESMALAYATNGSKFQGNKELCDEIIELFIKQSIECYNKENGGFFWAGSLVILHRYAISSHLCMKIFPKAIDTYVDAIDFHNPTVGYTYANRMWIAKQLC